MSHAEPAISIGCRSSATAKSDRFADDSPFCESQAMNAPLHEIERLLRAQGREMLRAMMQARFDRDPILASVREARSGDPRPSQVGFIKPDDWYRP